MSQVVTRLNRLLLSGFLSGLLVFGLMSPAALAVDGVDRAADFNAGVQAYRDGQYMQAQETFERLHQGYPEDARYAYYLAISEAQLGRFRQAKRLYEEIVTLYPNSEAAPLARQGLEYLPEDQAALDLPPRFQANGQAGPVPTVSANPAAAANSTPPNGMNPQDMMAWQMMMSQFGGGGNGSNPMAWMMMPQLTGTPGQAGPQIDPNVMSNLLMNQMMQNFSLDENKDD